MNKSVQNVYRCPVDGTKLTLQDAEFVGDDVVAGILASENGQKWPIKNGLPNFIYPQSLGGADAEFCEKYNKTAVNYDTGLEWLFKSFYEDEAVVRNSMIDLLGVQPGQRILEVGCGTGKDSEIIARRLNASGQLFVHELSEGMLTLCRERLTKSKVEAQYLLGNASYLPFPDQYFDAVFHFGGINTFNEKERAFEEFTRVTKVGGTVVVGDESVPPWLREKLFGKVLMNANPLYKHQVPLECLPESARNVSVRWLLGSAFYVIRYEVGVGQPAVDMDLPIPGRGDSLRSRYAASESMRA